MIGKVFYKGIEHNAIAVSAGQGRVSFQFSKHVIVRVIGIETHKDAGMILRVVGYLTNDLRINARSLDHFDEMRERMRLDRGSVVGTDIDINAEDTATASIRV